ncbi:hypothetical protein MUP32_05310 [Candidatus Microgenomates bacterium]|nr:hypothetical protein [Candidatus Microgenomates bacterium]
MSLHVSGIIYTADQQEPHEVDLFLDGPFEHQIFYFQRDRRIDSGVIATNLDNVEDNNPPEGHGLLLIPSDPDLLINGQRITQEHPTTPINFSPQLKEVTIEDPKHKLVLHIASEAKERWIESYLR